MLSLSLRSRRSQLRIGLLIFCGLLALLAGSCRHESVITENRATKVATPPPDTVARAVATPTMDPVGPTGQTPTPHANGGAAINPPPQIPKTKIQTEAITQSARTMGTPPPPPVIKPRPTPTIVMKDGKIVQQWQAPPEAASVANPFKGQAEAVKLGREYYMQRCEACHGKEGNGNGWMSSSIAKPPTNLTSTMVQANTDGELFWKITHGRSPMPANHVRFTDEQRWQIVTFLRTLK